MHKKLHFKRILDPIKTKTRYTEKALCYHKKFDFGF